MNSGQRLVLTLGILAVLALGLFPPCIAITSGRSGRASEEADGHRFVFSLPATEDHSLKVGDDYLSIWVSYRIDYARLGMFLGIVGIATLGGLAVFKGGSAPGTSTR